VLNCAVVGEVIPTGAVIADVGSGAGLPGIPLALARPDCTIVLIEPLLRRATFLAEVVAELDVSNCRVVRARAEDLAPRSGGRRRRPPQPVDRTAVAESGRATGTATSRPADGAVSLGAAAQVSSVADVSTATGSVVPTYDPRDWEPVDVVTSRAVAALDALARWCVPLLRPGGVVLAMKGSSAAEELRSSRGVLTGLGLSDLEVLTVGQGVVDPPALVVRAVLRSTT
jgi:16S rRNA G527 N7-methylase RsmG